MAKDKRKNKGSNHRLVTFLCGRKQLRRGNRKKRTFCFVRSLAHTIQSLQEFHRVSTIIVLMFTSEPRGRTGG